MSEQYSSSWKWDRRVYRKPHRSIESSMSWMYQDDVDGLASADEHKSSPMLSQDQYEISGNSRVGWTSAEISAQPVHEAEADPSTTTLNHDAGFPILNEYLDASAHGKAVVVKGKTFKRVPPNSFLPGTVFQCILKPEAAPRTLKASSSRDSILTLNVNEDVEPDYGEIRTFVVLRDNKNHTSTCLAISTYNRRGVSKKRLEKSNHAMVYLSLEHLAPVEEELRTGEADLRRSIKVDLDRWQDRLHPESRVDLLTLHTCRHDWNVYILGRVAEDFWAVLLDQHKAVLNEEKKVVVEDKSSLRALLGSKRVSDTLPMADDEPIIRSHLGSEHKSNFTNFAKGPIDELVAVPGKAPEDELRTGFRGPELNHEAEIEAQFQFAAQSRTETTDGTDHAEDTDTESHSTLSELTVSDDSDDLNDLDDRDDTSPAVHEDASSASVGKGIARLLEENPLLRPLLTHAAKRFHSSVFQDNLTRLLGNFGSHLQFESSSEIERYVAASIRSNARYTANEITTQLWSARNYEDPLKINDDKVDRKHMSETHLGSQARGITHIDDPVTAMINNEKEVQHEKVDVESHEPREFRLINEDSIRIFVTQSKAFTRFIRHLKGDMIEDASNNARVVIVQDTGSSMNRLSPLENSVPTAGSLSVFDHASAEYQNLYRRLQNVSIFALSHIIDHAQRILELADPTLKCGRYRVQWSCACGAIFHVDYSLEKLDEAEGLFAILASSGYKTSILAPANVDKTQRSPSGTEDDSTRAGSSIANDDQRSGTADGTTATRSSIINEEIRSGDACLTIKNSHANYREDPTANSWLILCFDHWPKAGKPTHVAVVDEKDQQLMSKLRKTYMHSKSLHRRATSWRAVKSVCFSKFLVIRDDQLDEDIAMRQEDWEPPTGWTRGDEWCPQPIGPKPPSVLEPYLLHLWNHPTNELAFKFQRCYRRAYRSQMSRLVKGAHLMARRCRQVLQGPTLPNAERSATDGEGAHELQILRASVPNGQRRSALILSQSPLKTKQQLQAQLDELTYGWGIYVEEKFAFPESVSILALFLALCLIIGLLVFCIISVGTYGMGVFGIWGGTIGLCGLILTVIFKYSDLKAA